MLAVQVEFLPEDSLNAKPQCFIEPDIANVGLEGVQVDLPQAESVKAVVNPQRRRLPRKTPTSVLLFADELP
jgi:hypothetical protein